MQTFGARKRNDRALDLLGPHVEALDEHHRQAEPLRGRAEEDDVAFGERRIVEGVDDVVVDLGSNGNAGSSSRLSIRVGQAGP